MVEVARPCFWCSAVHSLSSHLHSVASPSLLFHWLVRSKHEGGKARRSLIIVLYRMSTFIVAIVGTFQCRRWVLLDIGLVSLLLPKVVLLNSPSLPRCFVTYLLFYFHSTHYRGENISEFWATMTNILAILEHASLLGWISRTHSDCNHGANRGAKGPSRLQ
jgi:predicted permease